MENSNNNAKVIGAIMVGAAIGGALGILFAPDKGSETRKKIVGNTDELTDAIKEKFNIFLEDIKKEVESIKGKANEMIENGTTKAEKVRIN